MSGVLCVMTLGEVLMLLWCVDSLDILLKVRNHLKVFYMQVTILVSVCCFPLGAVAFSSAHFGAGTGPIHLDDVDCSGTESNITDCPHSSTITCTNGHSQDAGVRCQG